MVELFIRAERIDNPKATIREICQHFLDDKLMSELILGGRTIDLRTIETGHQHWKGEGEHSTQLDIDRIVGSTVDAFAAAFDTAQPQKMKVGKK